MCMLRQIDRKINKKKSKINIVAKNYHALYLQKLNLQDKNLMMNVKTRRKIQSTNTFGKNTR